jgi:hypothetical protein
VLLDLAHEIEQRGGVVALLPRLDLHRDVGDHADQQRFAAADAEKLAHGDGWLVGGVRRRGRQPDARLRAAHGNNAAERLSG